VKALPAAAGRARYARVVAIVAVAVLVVGGAAGAVAWSMGVRSAQVAAVAPLGRVPPAAVAAPTPVVVMVAAPASAVEPTPVVSSPRGPDNTISGDRGSN